MPFADLLDWFIYLQTPKPWFRRRRRRLVWRTPTPIYSNEPENDQVAQAWVFPTVSGRKIRWLGRMEVYPHSLHVHLTPIHRIEEP